MYTIIPKELRDMQGDWFQPGELPKSLEERIRFNSIAGMLGGIGNISGKYHIIDNASGGGGTICIRAVSENEFNMFCEQAIKHHYKEKYSKEHEDKLRAFLHERGVELTIDNNEKTRKGALKDIISIYSILPNHHFGHRHFTKFRLGGWGSGGTKCSQYNDPMVHMFSFATNGAKRNFRGLLLHETGHAVYENLKHFDGDLDHKLKTWARQMHQPFAIDYLFGKTERFERMAGFKHCGFEYFDSHEMAAESYLLYVANGKKMKEFISGLSGNERKAWENIYDMHLKSFKGVEYI